MSYERLLIERVCERVSGAESDVRSIVGVDLELRSEEPAVRDAVVQVAVEGENLSADLVVDVEREIAIATDIQSHEAAKAKGVLKACRLLGRRAECASLFASPESLTLGCHSETGEERGEFEDELWERAGFRKTFVLYGDEESPCTFSEAPSPEAGARSGESLLSDQDVVNYVAALERATGLRLEWAFAVRERPFIVSLDVATSLDEGENAPFHCFVHFHELTGACYIEKIVVPETHRGVGIGSAVFRCIRRLAGKAGCRYIYLVAKKDAEKFWHKQGLAPVHRVNYRGVNRRKRALRKAPGWDVARVGAERLENPVWHYRNHPQDDLDLANGLALLNLSSFPKRSRS